MPAQPQAAAATRPAAGAGAAGGSAAARQRGWPGLRRPPAAPARRRDAPGCADTGRHTDRQTHTHTRTRPGGPRLPPAQRVSPERRGRRQRGHVTWRI